MIWLTGDELISLVMRRFLRVCRTLNKCVWEVARTGAVVDFSKCLVSCSKWGCVAVKMHMAMEQFEKVTSDTMMPP